MNCPTCNSNDKELNSILWTFVHKGQDCPDEWHKDTIENCHSSDQSDKEMFDAQLISNLKKQIEDMHTALLQNSDAMHYLRDRVKELEEGLRCCLDSLECWYPSDNQHGGITQFYFNNAFSNLLALLPKEKQDD